jgi:hypothetical protein
VPEFTGVVTEPGLYPDIPEDVYHADPVMGGSLSNSGAKLLLPPNCPAVFDHARRHGGMHTKATDEGTRVHALVLGKGEDQIAPLDYENYRTDKAKAARDAARAAGKVPTLPHEMDEAKAIAKAVLEHDVTGGLFTEGDAEQSVFWQDGEFGVNLRMRMDWATWLGGLPCIVDFKTTADVSPKAFAKSCAEYGYFRQDPWYREGWASVLGCNPGEIDFVFAAVQTAQPYLVMTYRLLPEHVELGAGQNRIAREIYRDCTASGIWPAWSESIEDLPLPGWAVRDTEKHIQEWYA